MRARKLAAMFISKRVHRVLVHEATRIKPFQMRRVRDFSGTDLVGTSSAAEASCVHALSNAEWQSCRPSPSNVYGPTLDEHSFRSRRGLAKRQLIVGRVSNPIANCGVAVVEPAFVEIRNHDGVGRRLRVVVITGVDPGQRLCRLAGASCEAHAMGP